MTASRMPARYEARPRGRAGRFAATALAAALALGGCSLISPDDGATPEPSGTVPEGAATTGDFQQIEVPDPLATREPAEELVAVVPGTDGLPALTVSTEHLASALTRIGLWSSKDGRSWTQVLIEPPEGFSHRDIVVGTDGTRTVIVASQVGENHRRRLVAFESTDRVTWEPLDVIPTVNERGLVPQAVLVTEDSTVVVGVDGGFTPTALVMSERSRVHQLPMPPEGDDFGGFAGIAVSNGRIVAVGHSRTEGDDPGPLAYVSVDGGETWEEPSSSFGAARVQFSGVATTGDGFFATGAASAEDAWAPAAWRSDDGVSWTEERIVNGGYTDPEFAWFEGSTDAYLSAPVASGSRVVSTLTNTNTKTTVVYERKNGTWEQVGWSDNWIGRTVVSSAYPSGSGYVVARNIRSVLELATTEGQSWTANQSIGVEHGQSTSTAMVVNSANAVEVFGSEQTFQFTEPDNYHWAEVGTPWQVSVEGAGPAVSIPIDPADSEKIESRFSAADPETGAQVIAGSDFRAEEHSDSSDAFSWMRTSADGAWTPGTGLLGGRTETVLGVRRVGSQWVMVGSDNYSGEYTTDGFAAAWISDDGVNWTRADLDQSDESGKRSQARDACALPDGRVLIVGDMKRGTSGTAPIAWLQDGSSFRLVSESGTAFGGGGGTVMSCVGGEAGAVLQGTLAGQAMLWKTEDGRQFDQVRIGDRGESYGKLTSLTGGGYAAPGFIDRGGSYGAVIWMSRDGEHWFDVALPTSAPLTDGVLADRQGKVVLAAGDEAGWQLWILNNPYDIIS